MDQNELDEDAAKLAATLGAAYEKKGSRDVIETALTDSKLGEKTKARLREKYGENPLTSFAKGLGRGLGVDTVARMAEYSNPANIAHRWIGTPAPPQIGTWLADTMTPAPVQTGYNAIGSGLGNIAGMVGAHVVAPQVAFGRDAVLAGKVAAPALHALRAALAAGSGASQQYESQLDQIKYGDRTEVNPMGPVYAAATSGAGAYLGSRVANPMQDKLWQKGRDLLSGVPSPVAGLTGQALLDAVRSPIVTGKALPGLVQAAAKQVPAMVPGLARKAQAIGSGMIASGAEEALQANLEQTGDATRLTQSGRESTPEAWQRFLFGAGLGGIMEGAGRYVGRGKPLDIPADPTQILGKTLPGGAQAAGPTPPLPPDVAQTVHARAGQSQQPVGRPMAEGNLNNIDLAALLTGTQTPEAREGRTQIGAHFLASQLAKAQKDAEDVMNQTRPNYFYAPAGNEDHRLVMPVWKIRGIEYGRRPDGSYVNLTAQNFDPVKFHVIRMMPVDTSSTAVDPGTAYSYHSSFTETPSDAKITMNRDGRVLTPVARLTPNDPNERPTRFAMLDQKQIASGKVNPAEEMDFDPEIEEHKKFLDYMEEVYGVAEREMAAKQLMARLQEDPTQMNPIGTKSALRSWLEDELYPAGRRQFQRMFGEKAARRQAARQQAAGTGPTRLDDEGNVPPENQWGGDETDLAIALGGTPRPPSGTGGAAAPVPPTVDFNAANDMMNRVVLQAKKDGVNQWERLAAALSPEEINVLHQRRRLNAAMVSKLRSLQAQNASKTSREATPPPPAPTAAPVTTPPPSPNQTRPFVEDARLTPEELAELERQNNPNRVNPEGASAPLPAGSAPGEPLQSRIDRAMSRVGQFRLGMDSGEAPPTQSPIRTDPAALLAAVETPEVPPGKPARKSRAKKVPPTQQSPLPPTEEENNPGLNLVTAEPETTPTPKTELFGEETPPTLEESIALLQEAHRQMMSPRPRGDARTYFQQRLAEFDQLHGEQAADAVLAELRQERPAAKPGISVVGLNASPTTAAPRTTEVAPEGLHPETADLVRKLVSDGRRIIQGVQADVDPERAFLHVMDGQLQKMGQGDPDNTLLYQAVEAGALTPEEAEKIRFYRSQNAKNGFTPPAPRPTKGSGEVDMSRPAQPATEPRPTPGDPAEAKAFMDGVWQSHKQQNPKPTMTSFASALAEAAAAAGLSESQYHALVMGAPPNLRPKLEEVIGQLELERSVAGKPPTQASAAPPAAKVESAPETPPLSRAGAFIRKVVLDLEAKGLRKTNDPDLHYKMLAQAIVNDKIAPDLVEEIVAKVKPEKQADLRAWITKLTPKAREAARVHYPPKPPKAAVESAPAGPPPNLPGRQPRGKRVANLQTVAEEKRKTAEEELAEMFGEEGGQAEAPPPGKPKAKRATKAKVTIEGLEDLKRRHKQIVDAFNTAGPNRSPDENIIDQLAYEFEEGELIGLIQGKVITKAMGNKILKAMRDL